MTSIFKRAKINFLNLKIRWKVLLIFLICGVFPFLCYIQISNNFMNRIILERETSIMESALNQAVMSVENELETYNNLSNYMFNNTSILQALNREYDTDYFSMYKAYQDVIEPLFLTYYALHPDLQEITIYSSCDLHPYNGYIRDLSELGTFPWYPQVQGQYTPVWVISEEEGVYSLYSVRLIGDVSKYRNENYLLLKVNFSSLFAPFSALTEDESNILVTDSSGNPIYSSLPYDSLDMSMFSAESKEAFVQLSSHIEESDWQVYYSKPYSSVVSYVHSITQTIYAFGWIIMIFLGIMVLIISLSIVSPLETLTSKIRMIRHSGMDHLLLPLDSTRKDEIGILFQNITQMMEQIHHYIEVNLKNELEKKVYQQKILYAQINPHFLYNSLSLINSKAILSGQEEISDMVLLLSTFYRTALNRGRDMTTVGNEFMNIKAYIQIQQLSYSEPITVSCEMDQELTDTPFPNFILQPLVENALDHGLKNSLRSDKELRLLIRKETGLTPASSSCISISIHDNGCGMDPETVKALFQIQTSGYGIKNVNDRLRLLYGDSYILSINSEPGRGTAVTLKVPLAREDQTAG